MCIWATELPLKSTATVGDLLAVAAKWAAGQSPRNGDPRQLIESPEDAITTYPKEDHVFNIAKVTEKNSRWAALRKTWIDKQGSWDTKVVGRQTPEGLSTAIQIRCDLFAQGGANPIVENPHIIRLFMDKIGGGRDGNLTVQRIPHHLAEMEVNHIAAVIRGEAACGLPVVWLSAGSRQPVKFDQFAQDLAWQLAGLAHVLVEPSRSFGVALAAQVDDLNTTGGVIGIYWPGAIGKPMRVIPERFAHTEVLTGRIVRHLTQAATHRRITPEVSWDYILETISRQKIANLKSAGTESVEEYVEAFSIELAKKQTRLDDASAEIDRLRQEIRRLNAETISAREGILKFGREKPLYSHEIREAVLYVLEKKRSLLTEDGRVRHIIDDLLQANPSPEQGIALMTGIKQALAGDRDLTRKARDTLTELGFAFEKKRKHLQLIWRGDPRYSFTTSSSTSDHRMAKNLTSDIRQKLFL